jgi:tRNA threonylcarbamoyladenosine biosynthesis protein TsaE
MEQESKTVVTASAAETEMVGEAIGRQLRGGEVLALASDLGGGKTTFVRGLARGAGSHDHVASPTFTVSKVYTIANGLEIQHFDFYRLQEPGIMRSELAELVGDPQIVVVVEWSDIVTDVLPAKRLVVHLRAVENSADERHIGLQYPASLAYLLQDVDSVERSETWQTQQVRKV